MVTSTTIGNVMSRPGSINQQERQSVVPLARKKQKQLVLAQLIHSGPLFKLRPFVIATRQRPDADLVYRKSNRQDLPLFSLDPLESVSIIDEKTDVRSH